MSVLTANAVINKLTLDQLHTPEEYLFYTKRGLSRDFADGILQRYGATIASKMNPTTLDLELKLSLYVASREELEEYVQSRIQEALGNQRLPPAAHGKQTLG